MNRIRSYKNPPILTGLLAMFLFGAGWVIASQPDAASPVLARAGEVAVTTEAEVQAMFVRTNTQRTARHLYARTREEAGHLPSGLYLYGL